MSPDEFTGGPVELFSFADDASNNPTFYADITNPQSLNKYQYCYNNPLKYIDSNGHQGQGQGTATADDLYKVFNAFAAVAARASAVTPYALPVAILAGGAYLAGKAGANAEEPSAATRFNDAYQRALMNKADEDAKDKVKAAEGEKEKSAPGQPNDPNDNKPDPKKDDSSKKDLGGLVEGRPQLKDVDFKKPPLRSDVRDVKSVEFKQFLEKNSDLPQGGWKYVMQTFKDNSGKTVERHFFFHKQTGRSFYHK